MRSSHRTWKCTGLAGLVLVACGAPGDDGAAPPQRTEQSSAALRVGVPARIQAEAYDRAFESTPASNSGGQCDRGDGVDMELTSDANGGACNVGWTAAGEWLEFGGSTATAGALRLTVRLA